MRMKFYEKKNIWTTEILELKCRQNAFMRRVKKIK